AMLPDRCGSKHQAPRQGVFFLLLPPLFSLIIAQTPDSFRNQGFVDGLLLRRSILRRNFFVSFIECGTVA
ncbi:MAG: hypothetical protein IKJ65_09980, partial [Clostridia bacterium]|nr:hypothetical protein [Clostridia bacterium]